MFLNRQILCLVSKVFYAILVDSIFSFIIRSNYIVTEINKPYCSTFYRNKKLPNNHIYPKTSIILMLKILGVYVLPSQIKDTNNHSYIL